MCDPFQPSLDKARKVMTDFDGRGDPLLGVQMQRTKQYEPMMFTDEEELIAHVDEIDLLVIASPNYMHTPTLLRWGRHSITILVEKPVAVSQQQHDDLFQASSSPEWKARVWVAMEYRYIPAIAKLLELIPSIGDLKMIAIRENRYPFLHKVRLRNRCLNGGGIDDNGVTVPRFASLAPFQDS